MQQENNEESGKKQEKIASKKRSSNLFEYTFRSAKLILTSSCSIVRDSAVPTEKKRSELNSVIAFMRHGEACSVH